MDTNTLIIMILVGALSGWLAGEIRRGYGFGLAGNVVVGIIGSFFGRWLFGQMGIAIGAGLLGSVFVAVVGALVLLFLISLVRR